MTRLLMFLYAVILLAYLIHPPSTAHAPDAVPQHRKPDTLDEHATFRDWYENHLPEIIKRKTDSLNTNH